MTSHVIYHDFGRNNSVSQLPEKKSTLALSATMLAKGRRIAKWNKALGCACVMLCGACIGASVLVLCMLLGV